MNQEPKDTIRIVYVEDEPSIAQLLVSGHTSQSHIYEC